VAPYKVIKDNWHVTPFRKEFGRVGANVTSATNNQDIFHDKSFSTLSISALKRAVAQIPFRFV